MLNLNNGIYQIDAHYVAEGIAGIYIIVENGKCAIIETGTTHSLTHILKGLKALNLTVKDVLFVIPTHIHLDHVGGASVLLEYCPNAQLVVHSFGEKHMIDPSKLIEGTKAVYGEEKFQQLYGEIKPIEKNKIIALQNGEINLNGRILKIIDTPGHANHHFCIFDIKSEGVFTGDTFGVAYPQLSTNNIPFVFATTTPVQFNPDKLLDSIDKICLLQPKYFYLTHFGKVTHSVSFVTQLKNSILAFKDIALNSDNLTKDLQIYLLEKLKQSNCPLSIDEQKKIIKADIFLNAQGLKIWMSRSLKL
jgi:glyoxylase-like metal-dependent hydrolase (beta-lactamase superfamily II)